MKTTKLSESPSFRDLGPASCVLRAIESVAHAGDQPMTTRRSAEREGYPGGGRASTSISPLRRGHGRSRIRSRRLCVALVALWLAGPATAIPIGAADTGTEAAMALFLERRYDESLAAAKAVLVADPENGEALALAGSALVRLERLEEAAAFLERARARAPERAGIAYQLGLIALARADEASRKRRAFESARRCREALAAFDEELRLVPGSQPAMEGRAVAARRLGDAKLTISALEALLDLRPADVGAAVALIEAYAAAGRWDAMTALARRPTSSREVLRAAVFVLLEQYRYAECDPLFERVGAESGDLDLRALSAARHDRLDEALDLLEQFRATGVPPAALDRVRRLASDLLLVRSLEHLSKNGKPSLSPEEQQARAPSPDTILPVLKKKVEPVYPEGARAERSSGRVVLHCAVFPDGVPLPVAILATNDRRFVRSAIDAVRQWRYEPARRGGEAILAHYTVVIRYNVR